MSNTSKMKFKVGDRVRYDSGDPYFEDTGTIIKVNEDMFSNGAYYIRWDKYPAYSNKWISDGNLTLITEPTVKSAIEAKADLEKKILKQVQEYNNTYGVVVSDINIRKYSGVQYMDESKDTARFVQNISVDIEVRL